MLLVVVSGDKGFAGAFNANILKAAYQFIDGNTDKEIDIEAWAARAATRCGGAIRRRSTREADETSRRPQAAGARARKGKVEVTGDHPGMLVKLETLARA